VCSSDLPFLSLEGLPDFIQEVGVPDELWTSQEEEVISPLFDYEGVEG